MEKKNAKSGFDSNINWYALWMEQSKQFFESANQNLKDIFTNSAHVNPEDHIKEINLWLESLKSHWQFNPLNEQQKAYEGYWKLMSKMCIEASDLMVKQWMQRTKEQHPISNVRELYELWLNCCNEVYSKAIHSKSYQDTYTEFLNTAIHFWKSAIHR